MSRRTAIASAPMLGLVALACTAMLAAGDPPAPAAEDAALELGARLFGERCASCHFVPDAAIERDRVWIGLLRTTA